MVATARDIILQQPHDLRNKTGIQHTQEAFINVCAYAMSHYSYSATKEAGRGGRDVLAMPSTDRPNVDCATLAEAFLVVVKEDLDVPEQKAELANVFGAFGFATKASSRCFDAAIVGNVRTLRGDYKKTSRCVFGEHWFAKVGNRYYDPCMLAEYADTAEVKNWVFGGAYGKYYGKVLSIESQPDKFLIRIPPNDRVPLPPGFRSSMLVCDRRALDAGEHQAAFRAEKVHNQPVTWTFNEILRSAGCKTYDELN